MTASGTSDEETPPIVTHDHQAELPSVAEGARWGRSFHSLGVTGTIMRTSLAIAFPILLLASANGVLATAMIEPQRVKTTVEFDNGDRVVLKCPAEEKSCRIDLLVNLRQFSFGQAEIGAVILPFNVSLYSGPFSERDEYFSFEVEVECPEDSNSVCAANVLIETGKPPLVKIGAPESDT
ncbi:MAG: hypothetical protein BWZ07_03016 [Alphaproteobacteria bacterium ADurb.BinA280]|nr:hypothetical protein [Aquimonas sp.]OPZ09322.1 MAG: hypothetical protein BWZ07_03016 [Alphaproteobacteria bacterium ADurb.BinA280]